MSDVRHIKVSPIEHEALLRLLRVAAGAVSHLQPGDREGHKYVVGYLLSHCSLAPKEALELFEFIDRNGEKTAPADGG